MYEAWLERITIGTSQLEKYKVWVSVDYHGIEEEVVFRYKDLKDIPRFLFSIEDGKVKYSKGLEVRVSHPFEDANGLKMGYIYESEAA